MINKVPTLHNSIDLDKHHFGETEWKPEFASFSDRFHINRIEDMKDKIKFPLPPHRKTVYDFIFLTQGTSLRSKGIQNYHFSENMFFFLPAYQISAHEYYSKDAKGFFCHFDASIFSEIFQKHHIFDTFPFLNFINEPIIVTSRESKYLFNNILERLEIEYAKKDLKKFDIVAAYLFTLFNEVNQFVKQNIATKQNAALRITESYKNALSRHIYTKEKVSDYADLLAISPDHLNKSVKTSTGKSAQELLGEMLILEAKVLLRQTNFSIAEIAFKLCERNPSEFSRFFRGKTGISPKTYKQMPDIAH